MRRWRRTLAVLGLGVLVFAAPAEAFETGKYLFDVGERILAVRAADVDGDGRTDLVLLTDDGDIEHIVVLRSPDSAAKRSFFPPDAVTRIDAGRFKDAGALALGRFGRSGEVRLRLLGPDGVVDLDWAGRATARDARYERPTLLARSPGRRLVFWDAVADLDGDGLDEVWFPVGEGNGAIRVFGGTPEGDRQLSLEPVNEASYSAEHMLVRHARVPRLVPTDLDGDGVRELVTLSDHALLGWTTVTRAGDAPMPPSFRMPLPFLERDPDIGAQELATPRVQLEDVDGDGKTDLLVTLISGRRDRLGSLRTTLFHFPGPFRDPETGELVPHRARIDTESAALHPTFVDLDGDGDKDYVGDSIRGTRLDLIARIMGQDPTIWYVGFRFDKKTGTFESSPYFTTERVYSSAQALSNAFGRSAWFEGDFDGDGTCDLLDLGDLGGVEILRGVVTPGSTGEPLAFSETLMPRVQVKDGLATGAVIADLSGDGRSDAVLWSAHALYVIVPKGGR